MHKIPSLPKNWPRPTQEDLDNRPERIVSIGSHQEYSFCNNSIRTYKYEWYTFPGKFLMEEFNPKTKIANCYFLTIAGMQCIGPISNTNGYPTVLIPLFVVLVVAGLFKALEDIARHKADKKANSSTTEVFERRTRSFKTVLWAEVQVGDVVRVHSREVVPADVVILEVSEPNPAVPKGVCYVETKSLDGETNLKVRNVMPALLGKLASNDDLIDFRGRIAMEHPNNLIDSFTGVLTSELLLNNKAAIAPKNVVLRGCVLRSTEWMIGLAVNTGHDVKIMQSNMDAKVKSSNLDGQATQQIKGIIMMLLWVCLCGAIGQAIFNSVADIHSHWYLQWDLNAGKVWIIEFFYELLLHASMIPVSLYVSMAIVRFTQSVFMNGDLDMYYEPLDAPAVVRTMTLNEELGQVSHIFSDKTGTLTCNNMNFRKASINGVVYGQGITEIGRAAWKLLGKPVPADVEHAETEAALLSIPHVTFYDPNFYLDYEQTGPVSQYTHPSGSKPSSVKAVPGQKQKIQEFYRYIAVCHEVVPERLEDGSIKLSAPNPDDEALVCAAAFFGYEFKDRRERVSLIYETATNKMLEITVLYTIPFTSSRKRMSVIIRDIDGQIKIITKGADSMMFTRVDTHNAVELNLKIRTEQDIDQFSLEGLRCLVLAANVIDEQRFRSWSREYDEANTNLVELDKRKRHEKNEIDALEDQIEKNLHIVGATAIEDRLQEGVPECIEKLVQANINVWVLTGDKEETAINIAVACNLVLPAEYMEQVVINKNTATDIDKAKAIFTHQLQQHLQHSGEHDWKPRALIIDGPSLIFVMADIETRHLLLKFSQTCKAVVCCRVSPDQKREIVMLVRKGVPGVRTLAVGDGANDVAMITAAHIGVGIKGEEGVQAVNASDYAISQFRFLTPLLLKHGRYNYIRMSNLVCYMFYKNILMSLSMFWFNFLCAFSGEKMFTEGAIQFFNLFYTSIPILLYATYDKDVAVDDAITFPQLYTAGIKNAYFNSKIFWGWVVDAFVESVLCCILSFYFLHNFDQRTGVQSSYFESGALCFTTIIIVINLKMFKIQSEWYSLSVVILLLSFGTWIGVAYIVSGARSIDPDFYFTWSRMLQTGVFWLALLVLVVMISLKDIFLVTMERAFSTDPRLILQEMRAFHMGHHCDNPDDSQVFWQNPNTTTATTDGKDASAPVVAGALIKPSSGAPQTHTQAKVQGERQVVVRSFEVEMET